MREKPDFRITGKKAEIPSEDIWNWQRALEKGDFTREEIDEILAPLSIDYRWAKSKAKLEGVINGFVNEIRTIEGKPLGKKEREKLVEEMRAQFQREVEKGSS